MWLNEIASQTMFIEKVRKQKLELEAARKRNIELLKKYQRLEKEQNELNELVESNQVEVITKKNGLNELLAELKNQKRLNLTLTQRLEICKEQINMIQDIINQTNDNVFDSLTELKPIKEQLSFKWDVVECLQNKLVETRLQNAEKEALITELKQREKDLRNDLEMLKKTEKITLPVSELQEQFLAARIREADVVLEFDKLKRSLAILKQELEEKKKETELELMREAEETFHISFNLRDRYHEQLKQEEEASIAKTVELQNEIDHLKMQIRKLEEIKRDTIGRVYFNEEVKVHLHEVKTSIFLRLQKTNKELLTMSERNKRLEMEMQRNLIDVQHRIDDKDIVIAQLVEETKNMQLQNETWAKTNDESMASMNKETVSNLQSEIDFLKGKIASLKES